MLSTIVPQRTRYDCAVAALATLQGWTYEKARTVLGTHATTGGTCLLPLVVPLLKAGIAGTYLMAREHPNILEAGADRQNVRMLAASEEIRRLLPGRRAILGVEGAAPDDTTVGRFGHAVVWDGERVIECGATGEWARPATEHALGDHAIWEALILTDEAPSLRKTAVDVRALSDPAADSEPFSSLFDRHERVFLGFSGGKESITLAHMLEPWQDRVTLLWVNTGHMAPHMVEFVRNYRAKGWRLEEAASPNLFEHWQATGIPAEVFPLANITGSKSPRLQPWLHCCQVLRTEPINAFLREQTGPCCFINGQRADDQDGATIAGLATNLPGTVEVVMPLRSWTEADVMAYVSRHELALPLQYAEGYADSIECIVCPAPLKPKRLRYLARHHPEVLPFIQGAVQEASAATVSALGNLQITLSGGEPSL
jgi:3'-phosphoadenosine 5'-phosphosulfate sulfotransferase (PAPS reductase)/FAD synthetase